MIDKDTEDKTKMLSALGRVQNAIERRLELEKVSEIVIEELAAMVTCSTCAMMLIEGEEVKILAEKNFSKQYGEVKSATNMPVLKYVVNTKQSVLTGDIASSPAAHCVPPGSAIRSLMCTPVTIGDQVKGLFYLDSGDENVFDEEDLIFVQLLAKGISIAMEGSFLRSQVQVLTVRDNFIGCFNRTKLEEDLEGEIARAKRYERPLSFLMIGIDWFKEYNDFHGDTKGNELLKKIVDIFTRNVRNTDKVYRYGREEFVILLPETEQENVMVVAKRLQKAIEQEQFEGEQESQPNKSITVSIGVASYPWDGNSKSEMLESAENALDRAKQAGGNCFSQRVEAESSVPSSAGLK